LTHLDKSNGERERPDKFTVPTIVIWFVSMDSRNLGLIFNVREKTPVF
jgi:hypothetical protein